MALFDKLMGNAMEMSADKINELIGERLVPGEEVVIGFQLVRDASIFTNKRLLIVDIQGVSGSKREYKTIPYSKIRYFSTETSGTFDRDSEIKIYLDGGLTPTATLSIRDKDLLLSVENTLSQAVLNSN